MLVFLLVLVALVASAVYRATTAEQRQLFIEEVVQPAAARMDALLAETAPYRASLHTRTPRLIATPVLAGLNVLMFLAMLFGNGSFDSAATLIDWGANHGPRTTNGEWWRLLTAQFVHGGLFDLLFVLIGFVQVAELLERLVGGPVVAGVFLIAGTLASLVSVVDHPLAIHAGASAGVYGLFGLLLAMTGWSALRPGAAMIPWAVYQTLVPATVLFFLDAFITDGIGNRPNLTGLMVGMTTGVAVMAIAGERKLGARPYAVGMALAVALMLWIAWPLREIADVRPNLIELVTNEDRQTSVFRMVMDRFHSRQVPIDRQRVATLIEQTFVPQVADARRRIEAFRTTLSDQQPLVARAAEYARLREESWRLRAQGLKSGQMAVLREADRTEMAARAALDTLRSVEATVAIHR